MKKIKVKVKRDFRDKYTGIKHNAGTTMEVTDSRFREINRSGDYLEVVNEVKKN